MVYKLPPAFADDCTWQQLSCKIAKNASAIEMSRPTFTQQFGGFAAVNYCNIFHCMLSICIDGETTIRRSYICRESIEYKNNYKLKAKLPLSIRVAQPYNLISDFNARIYVIENQKILSCLKYMIKNKFCKDIIPI